MKEMSWSKKTKSVTLNDFRLKGRPVCPLNMATFIDPSRVGT